MTYFSNWIILFPIATTLFVALRMAAGSHDDGRRTVALLTLRLLAFLFFFFAFVSVGLRASPLSIVWILILLAMAIVMFFKNRRLERSALFYTLMHAQNSAQRTMLAEAFYSHNVGYVRRRARALIRSLAYSTNWAGSVEGCRIAKSSYERLSVRLRARYGFAANSPMNEQLEQNEPLFVEQELERTLGRLLTLAWIVLLIPLLAFFMTFILPTFKYMFDEFGLDFPPVMQFMVSLVDDFAVMGWTSLLALLPLAFMAMLAMGMVLWFFPQLTRLPGIDWFFQSYYRNLGFVALRHACHHEPDLQKACEATAQLVPVGSVASSYHRAAELLRQGQLPSAAFAAAGVLLRREVRALAAGLDSSDPSWGLRQLASWKTERLLRRISTTVQWLIVSVTLLMGLIVGTFATGVLQTLSIMIIELGVPSWR